MEEKKYIKVSLGTVVCLFVILILIIALGFTYYIYSNKISEHEKDLIDYASKLIDFDFSNYVINAEGEYEVDKANITFELDSSRIEDFKTNIVNSIGILPVGMHVETNIKDDAIIEKYYTLKGGEIMKTIHINGVLYSKDNKYYFNITES